jgi:3-hydroxyisobutyrate dehydrogenase-like beta-hydroxyacid dehydrogenase
MSTISVALSDHLTEAHGKAGQGYVAAPVFGRPEAAAAAKLFIIAAGADEMLKRCHPLFDAMGQEIFVISTRPSEANLVKLSGNFLIEVGVLEDQIGIAAAELEHGLLQKRAGGAGRTERELDGTR